MSVRRLDPGDAPALFALRREALDAHPLAFGASPDNDRMRTPEGAAKTLAAADALRLYAAAGFRPGGREPRSLCWEGRYVAQTFMTLDLDQAPG